jgi:hypothetical protein
MFSRDLIEAERKPLLIALLQGGVITLEKELADVLEALAYMWSRAAESPAREFHFSLIDRKQTGEEA